MLNLLGIIGLAVAILVSVSLHEAGHMSTAKAFGMKVTKYFVGFGPTLWSFRRGETEYGVKGVPLGGFVKIVGMTQQDDDVEPEDEPRAMWRFPVWKRTIVMSAGSVVHFIIAFLIIWGVSATATMANPDNLGPNARTVEQLAQVKPYIQVSECVTLKSTDPECKTKDGPAYAAGLREGDLITSINGAPVTNYIQLVDGIRALAPEQPAQFGYERDGVAATATVTPKSASRKPINDQEGKETVVAVVGLGAGYDPHLPSKMEYNAVEALPVATGMVGDIFDGVIASIKKFPEKIPGLWTAITGGKRDPNSPVSVVGASRIGGELAQVYDWPNFFMVIASLNLFVGLFNLLPLLPLDGGHIAVAWFEKLRSWVYALLRKPDPGRVDYQKLMPLTYTVILIFGAFTLLTVTADIVNPITILK